MTGATHQHAAALVPLGTWHVDQARSSVGFSNRHMMVATVRGRFTEFVGAIERDERGTRVHGVVKAASFDSANEVPDDRVRGADFLDAEAHPEMRFVSRRVEPAGERAWRIACDLTIAGVTRPVELQATARRADDGDGLAFVVRGSLRRSQFGIDPKSLLEAGVSDRVDLTLDIRVLEP
jgi:polyisoprenoid-binding protein YceI